MTIQADAQEWYSPDPRVSREIPDSVCDPCARQPLVHNLLAEKTNHGHHVSAVTLHDGHDERPWQPWVLGRRWDVIEDKLPQPSPSYGPPSGSP